MTEPQSPFLVDSTIKDLQQSLLELQHSEKELQTFLDGLNEELINIDKMLPAQVEEWQKLREKHFAELEAKLEAEGISLTAEEKAELRSGSATYASIKKKLEKLKKLQLELEKASDFVVVTCDAIVAALSRSLQKVDSKSVKDTIKKLKKVIGNENDASNEIRSNHKKQYEKIIAAVKELEKQIAAIILPDADKLQRIEQQINSATQKKIAQAKAEAATPKA